MLYLRSSHLYMLYLGAFQGLNVLALQDQCGIEKYMLGTFAEGSLGRELRL